MTRLDFIALCGELTLDTNLVIRDKKVQAMLIKRKDQELRKYLESKY